MPKNRPGLQNGDVVTPKRPDDIEFDALEYREDDTFQRAHIALRVDERGHWRVERNGQPHLELGAGYTPLRTRACGVCSTDLDRRFLPFPLPQIIGHEAVVEDAAGQRFVVEINASHAARGVSRCAFCRAGLETHCPERIVFGIHDLPGGFGPFILAPEHALVPLPDAIPDSTAALIEPFAAALHAVTTIDPQPQSQIAVLGPRRLGLLVIAALAAFRRASGRSFEIVAFARRPELGELALELGADRFDTPPADAASASRVVDVVIDTTGSPEGLELASALARDEVHLKSTHGRPALGLTHITEAVVDEIAFCFASPDAPEALRQAVETTARHAAPDRLRVGWLCNEPPPTQAIDPAHEIIEAQNARALLEALEVGAIASPRDELAELLPRVDVLVLDDARRIDDVLRPIPGQEKSPLRPRGKLILRTHIDPDDDAPPIARVLMNGIRITTSRCGNFHDALELITGDPALHSLGDRLVTHHFAAEHLDAAFEAARTRNAIKVIVDHAC